MPDLPIRRMVIYKHGVGYFERRGPVSGTELRLSFPREAMDDVLKSLVALDTGAGQVLGVDFETPEDRAARLAKGSIHLSDSRSLLDLLRDLRGRRVRLEAGGEPVEGTILGVDLDEGRPLASPLVSIALADGRTVRSLPVRDVRQLTILDDRAAEDLAYFLRASQSEEDRRAATLHLSEGEHQLLVGYVAPAPAWRVSYRIIAEQAEGQGADRAVTALLQGWGLFDNQLEEDLEGVALTLVAGMPVSFRYRLYEPRTPERPLVEDESRTVAAPVEFGAMPQPLAAPAPAMMAAPAAGGARMKRARMGPPEPEAMDAISLSFDDAARSVESAGAGEERGALFQYRVTHPVSVARGQSAMVPIVVAKLEGRKELLYNGSKHPRNPVASLRARNTSGLTLERGPVTVVDSGDYAGEAVLPFSRPGAELIVPYAVELGVSVTEEPGSERVISAIQIHRDGYLLVHEWEVQSVTYRILSQLAEAAEVLVEQREPVGYEPHETPAPAERAQGLARWAVACAPGAETTFVVRHRRLVSRREQVRGVRAAQLQDYMRRRFLDEAALRGLEGVLATYGEVEARQQRQRQIEQERQQIYKRQQQTQGSLGPLARDGEEGKLRGRYVQQLNELENQLNALAAEEQRLAAEVARLEQQAAERIAALAK